MTKSRIHLMSLAGAAALAVASAATPALADNPPPGLLAKIQIATQAYQSPSPGALTDLPAPPRPAPHRANDRQRIAGPADGPPKPAAWHEAVLVGDIVAARKSVPQKAPKTGAVLKTK